jgi:hypothetical protein
MLFTVYNIILFSTLTAATSSSMIEIDYNEKKIKKKQKKKKPKKKKTWH